MQVEYLRKFWIDASLAKSSQQSSGLKGWLSSEDYFVNPSVSEKKFSLYVRNPVEFRRALSFDGFRMGINSLQSIHGIRSNPVFSQLSAWHLIQAYYSAFFAAHGMMRIFGRPVTHFEKGHSAQISRRAKNEIGEICSISDGHFCANYNTTSNNLDFELQKDSHRDLWRQYNLLLRYLAVDVLTARGAMSDLGTTSNFLSDLSELLHRGKGRDCGNWLSSYRNDINYKSPVDVWYPFTGNTVKASRVFLSVKVWQNGGLSTADCLSKKSEVEVFFLTCMLVVQLTTEVLLDYCKIAEKGNSRVLLFNKFRDLARVSHEV